MVPNKQSVDLDHLTFFTMELSKISKCKLMQVWKYSHDSFKKWQTSDIGQVFYPDSIRSSIRALSFVKKNMINAGLMLSLFASFLVLKIFSFNQTRWTTLEDLFTILLWRQLREDLRISLVVNIISIDVWDLFLNGVKSSQVSPLSQPILFNSNTKKVALTHNNCLGLASAPSTLSR